MQGYSDYSDHELLSFLKLGDNLAFTEIYNRHWKKLYALAYNRLRDIQIAEDVVHDVYTGLWNNRQTSEIVNLSAYLAVAVKYNILAHIRKAQTHVNFDSSKHEHQSIASLDIVEDLHNRRILALLHEEVERLPEKCKLIFKYSREAHMSVKEIADELQISTSTVENQLNKALGRLKAVIKRLNVMFFTFL